MPSVMQASSRLLLISSVLLHTMRDMWCSGMRRSGLVFSLNPHSPGAVQCYAHGAAVVQVQGDGAAGVGVHGVQGVHVVIAVLCLAGATRCWLLFVAGASGQ